MTTTPTPLRPTGGVRVEDDEVVLDDFREPDPQVVGLVTGSERPEDLVHQMLGVGARAIASTNGGLETERLVQLFDKLSEDFASVAGTATAELAEKATALLEEDGGLAKVLTAFQEDLATQLGDPDSAKSLVSQMREVLQRANEAHVEKLRGLFDPDQDGSPLQRQRQRTEEFVAQQIRVVREQMEGLGKELAGLRSVKEVYEKTAGKGFDFEDLVHEIVSSLVSPLGDVAEHVGREHGDKKGDVLVTLNPDDTGARGLRYLLEAKDRKLSLNEIDAELAQAMRTRDASCGVAVFSAQALAPSEVLFQYSGNKAIVVLDKRRPGSARVAGRMLVGAVGHPTRQRGSRRRGCGGGE